MPNDAAAPSDGGETPNGERKPGRPGDGTRRGFAGRRTPEGPGDALRGLLHGLRAGDLESILLTVAMAAEENRLPSADPDEAERILGFLARLAEYDTALPPPSPHGAEPGPARPVDPA